VRGSSTGSGSESVTELMSKSKISSRFQREFVSGWGSAKTFERM